VHVVYFIVANLCALLLTFTGYWMLSKRISKYLLADYSILMTYRVLFAPLIMAAFNFVLIKVLNLQSFYLWIIPLAFLYTSVFIIINKFRDFQDYKQSEKYGSDIRPIVIDLFMREQILIQNQNVFINAKIRQKKTQVEVVVKLGEKNKHTESIKTELRNIIDKSFNIDTLILVFDYKFVPKKKPRKMISGRMSLN
jgi:hypothetical protein